MAILCCNGNKCKMKQNCQRYNLHEKANKALISDFHTFCNKKNDYIWIMLEKDYKNKKMVNIYKEKIRNVGGK